MGRGVPWGVAWGMGSIRGLARDRPQGLFYIVWFFFSDAPSGAGGDGQAHHL